MTAFETFFVQTMDFFKARNVPIFLHGSTLLRIIRDNTVEPRPDVIHDKEINIGIRAEDFTDRLYKELRQSHPYFNVVNENLPNSMIFYAQEQIKPPMSTHWDIKPGFTLLARFWKGQTKRIEYMGEEHTLIFPAEFFDKLETIELFDRTFNIPSNPKKYLDYYFGKDWAKEEKQWHWSGAGAYRRWEDLGFERDI